MHCDPFANTNSVSQITVPCRDDRETGIVVDHAMRNISASTINGVEIMHLAYAVAYVKTDPGGPLESAGVGAGRGSPPPT